jgi:hypothetical protein
MKHDIGIHVAMHGGRGVDLVEHAIVAPERIMARAGQQTALGV